MKMSALRRALTPDYEIDCKRIPFSDEYYPTLSADNVTLEPSALAPVTATAAGVLPARNQRPAARVRLA